MLPMGSIMTVCMVISAVALAIRLLGKGSSRVSTQVSSAAGVLALAAGVWNAVWHAPRHITEFWGQAALVSGVLMMLAAAYLLRPSRLPAWLVSARLIVLIALVGCTALYGVTIYRL